MAYRLFGAKPSSEINAILYNSVTFHFNYYHFLPRNWIWKWCPHTIKSSNKNVGWGNGLSPVRRQAITSTNANYQLYPKSTKLYLKIKITKIKWKMSSAKFGSHCVGLNALTNWGPDKIAAISQTTFSNAFSWMKIYEFRLRCQWSSFLRVQLTIFEHWFRWWLGTDQAPSHRLNQWWLVYWRIYASLGLGEFNLAWMHSCRLYITPYTCMRTW